MKSFLAEFKKFVLRGNVLDLAVAVVVGTAFNAVVQSFANDVLLQLVAAIFGKPDFSDLSFTVNDTQIFYGRFLTAVVQFLITAFAVFVAIKTFERLQNFRKRDTVEDTPAPSDEAVLLTEIRDVLREQSRS
jgi:large conductance mechanosensitive channel